MMTIIGQMTTLITRLSVFLVHWSLKALRHPNTHLLQSGSAQLDGDVGEKPVPLSAEVADDVGVRVQLP